MVRIDPERQEELLAKSDCRPMDFTRRRSKGFVFVDPLAIKDTCALAFWLEVGLSFNSMQNLPSTSKPRFRMCRVLSSF